MAAIGALIPVIRAAILWRAAHKAAARLLGLVLGAQHAGCIRLSDLDHLAQPLGQPDGVGSHAVLEQPARLVGGRTGELGLVEQGADRLSGPFAGAQFHNLAQKNQRYDHGGGFEVDSDITVLVAKALGEYLGRDDREDTEHIGRAHAHADEAEHVQVHRPEGMVAAHKERPARPQDDRRRHYQFQPERCAFPQQFLEKGEGPLLGLLKNRQAFDENWKPPAKSPARYLESLSINNDMVAVHCNFIDNDIKLIKSAVFCPKSTEWFGRRATIPVKKMLDANIPVALGTDSMASNDSLNFLEEIRMADKLLPDVSRKEILKMATRYGAEILRFPCGTMEPGKKADLIGFRINTKMKDWHDLPFESETKKVDFYMVNGKF